MTHMTDEQIEAAFAQVREKFEARNNDTGLEMLDSVEERWEAMGELSDRQLAWLDRQLNETWKRKKPKTGSAASTGSPTSTPMRPAHTGNPDAVPSEALNHLIATLDAMKQALISLQRSAIG